VVSGPKNFEHNKINRVVEYDIKPKHVRLIATMPIELVKTPRMTAGCNKECEIIAVKYDVILDAYNYNLQLMLDLDPTKCDIYVTGVGGRPSMAFVSNRWWVVFGARNFYEPGITNLKGKHRTQHLMLHSLNPGTIYNPDVKEIIIQALLWNAKENKLLQY
jgi:hypothetical protein